MCISVVCECLCVCVFKCVLACGRCGCMYMHQCTGICVCVCVCVCDGWGTGSCLVLNVCILNGYLCICPKSSLPSNFSHTYISFLYGYSDFNFHHINLKYESNKPCLCFREYNHATHTGIFRSIKIYLILGFSIHTTKLINS